MSQAIPRRTFLRGVGVSMGLPLLEAMVPASAVAAAKKSPLRLAFVYIPNGANMADWKPAAEGTSFELPYILEPLKSVKDSLTVLTGLTQDKARPNGDGPGDHARSAASWLTGCQARKTSGADIRAGHSVDQIAARSLGNKTRFGSLELGCERGGFSGNCDSGYSCAYSSTISWRTETTPVAKEVNPRLVFERLFANGDPEETAENRARRQKLRKSILDFVMEDASRLKSKLGSHDRSKLEEYFSSVRDLEARVGAAGSGASIAAGSMAKPEGIPTDYAQHIDLMADMLVLAFQADLTRVATFMLANEGSNRSYRLIGIPEGHHDLSHHQRNPDKLNKIKEINRFHMARFGRMLEKMQAVKEGDGTLLDHSMVVYGSGIGDGDRHNHDDLPILLAGKGNGTLRTARHVTYSRNTPMSNLFLSLLDRLDVPAEKVGDSTGRLDGLM